MSKWVVKLICCGRDDGEYKAKSWEEADSFRESYCTGSGVNVPGGHQRVGIISGGLL